MNGVDDEALYRCARTVLLDALEALGDHRRAVTLVGAQAIYVRVGDADLAVAPYTTDADLIIDPRELGEIPPLERALNDASFVRRTPNTVGAWTRTIRIGEAKHEVDVDLMVPASVSPRPDGRAAGLVGHDLRAARNVEGLDGALEDRDPMTIAKLADDETDDQRSFEIHVAGPAALLLAKLYKIRDREGRTRASDKDALDVLRLLQGTRTEDLHARYRRLLASTSTNGLARSGLELLQTYFGATGTVGSQMIARAAGALADETEIAVLVDSCVALANDAVAALR